MRRLRGEEEEGDEGTSTALMELLKSSTANWKIVTVQRCWNSAALLSTAMKNPISSKIAWLDGLRGVAALVVLLAHFKELVLPGSEARLHFAFEPYLERSPLMILFASHLAVLIFFIHSGFVLSWKYLNAPDARILLSMAIRRFFRLGIPIGFAVWFAYALMRAGLMSNAAAAEMSGSPGAFNNIYTFTPTLYSAIVDSTVGVLLFTNYRYNGAFWTMPIELICSYAVFIVLPLVVRLETNLLGLLLLLASIQLLAPYPWLICFLIGILFVRLAREGHFAVGVRWMADQHRAIPILLAALAISFALWPQWIAAHLSLPEFLNPDEALQILSGALIIALLFCSPAAQRLLGSPLAQFLGRLSFPVYLLHLPILCSLTSRLFIVLHGAGWPYAANCALTFVATLAATYVAAYLMAISVDAWAINFGKRPINDRLYGRTAQAAAVAKVAPW